MVLLIQFELKVEQFDLEVFIPGSRLGVFAMVMFYFLLDHMMARKELMVCYWMFLKDFLEFEELVEV